jgi:hypothetical protein
VTGPDVTSQKRVAEKLVLAKVRVDFRLSAFVAASKVVVVAAEAVLILPRPHI